MSLQHAFNVTQYFFAATIILDCGILLFFIFQKHPLKIYKYFLIASSAIIIWEIMLWLAIFIEQSFFINITANYLAFILGPIVVLLVFRFFEKFYEQNIIPRYLKIVLIINTVLASALVFIFFPNRIVIGEKANEFFIAPSLSLELYYLSFIPITIIIFYAAIKIYHSTTGYKRKQAGYLLAGLVLAFSFVVLTSIFLPFLLKVFIIQDFFLHDNNNVIGIIESIGGMALSVWALFTGYAIIRYRLFNLYIKFQWKGIKYLVGLILAVTNVGLFLGLNSLFKLSLIWNGLIIFILVIFCQISIVYFLKKTSKYQFFDFIIPQAMQLSAIASREFKRWYDELKITTHEQYKLDHFTFYLFDHEQNKYINYHNPQQTPIQPHAELIQQFQEQHCAITSDTLKQHPNDTTRTILKFIHTKSYKALIPLYGPSGFVLGFLCFEDFKYDDKDRPVLAALTSLGAYFGIMLYRVMTIHFVSNNKDMPPIVQVYSVHSK